MWDGNRTHSYTIRVISWASLLTLALFNGIRLARSYEARQRAGTTAINSLIRRIQTNTALTAGMWGASSWFLLPASDLEHETILVLGIGLVILVSTANRAAYVPWLRYMAVTASTTFATGLVALPGALHLYLGLAFFVFGPVLALFSRAQSNALHKERELNIEIERLLHIAEEATKSKQNLLASVSHDLRQPLHALVHYVAHLDRVSTDASLRPTVDRIRVSVDAMATLLDAVLDFSRMTSGALQLRLEPVAVRTCLDKLENQLLPFALEKDIAFEVNPCDAHVLTDEALFERVVRNLAQNAIRYTAVGRVVIRAKELATVVRIVVSDSGIGIPKGEIVRIFDAYHQLGNPERNRERGLGLGLAIVRELTTLLQIRVRVRSRLDHGTTFVLDVPKSDEAAAILPRSVEPQAIGMAGTVVVCIDDDGPACDALSATLRDIGCRVISAWDVESAMAQLTENGLAPRVVVSDYRLARGHTGIEAVETLRQRQELLHGREFPLAAFIVSGDTSAEVHAAVCAASCLLLRKPVSVDLLHRALRQAIDNHSNATPD